MQGSGQELQVCVAFSKGGMYVQAHLFGSIDNALGYNIALHDASKDVDQKSLDLLV